MLTQILVYILIFISVIGLALLMPSADSAISFYHQASSNEPRDFLANDSWFEYQWWGDQKGKGNWYGYHWHFEERGKLEIVSVHDNIVEGVIEGRGEIKDNDHRKTYRFNGSFVLFLDNNTLVETFFTNYGYFTRVEHRYSIGPWFYSKSRDTRVIIMNDTFQNEGVSTTWVNHVPIRTIRFSRVVHNAEYYDDHTLFRGTLRESYFFDEKTGLMVYYELHYEDMWDSDHISGWDYHEYYKVVGVNIGLSIPISPTLRTPYYIAIILTCLYIPIILLILCLLAIKIDSLITQRKFRRILEEIKKLEVEEPRRVLEPYVPSLKYSGWLKPGFVVFEVSSGSHVLVDMVNDKQYSLTPQELKALKAMLSFKRLRRYLISILKQIDAKRDCIDFDGEEPSIDRLFRARIYMRTSYALRRLRFYLERWGMSPEISGSLIEFAYDIAAYRKILTDRFGQAYMIPPDNVYRALEIHFHAPREDILLIGDDDLLSLLLAFLDHNVYVVDVDDYVLRLIYFLAKKYGLENRIMLYRHDIRKPFDFRRDFRAVHIDPGYSLDGLILFMARAVQNLELGGYLFVSWRSRGVYSDFLKLSIMNHGLRLVRRSNFYLNYLIPVPGYYAHSSYKYYYATYFVRPTIKITTWKSAFFVCKYIGSFGYGVDRDKAYTGVLY